VENFGWNFSVNHYSEPEGMVLSSAAMVTAAKKVQRETAGTKIRRSWSERFACAKNSR
jgi:hypothetical protein